MRHIVYNATQISLVVSEFKIFGLFSLLQRVLHRHGTCTISYLYYLMVPSVENHRQHSFRIPCAKVSEAPTITGLFFSIMTSNFVIADIVHFLNKMSHQKSNRQSKYRFGPQNVSKRCSNSSQSNYKYFLVKVCSQRKVELQYCDKRSSFPGVTARNYVICKYFD